MATNRFNWVILQPGSLGLKPDGQFSMSVEHRPTSTLIWPENESPSPDNTILTDPYFTDDGFTMAEAALAEMGSSFADIGHIFVTHDHFDHRLWLPVRAQHFGFKPLEFGEDGPFAGISVVRCPGHHPFLQALAFISPAGERLWVVSDAVLNEEWLRAWAYYWPNEYSKKEVIETWYTIANIVAHASVIVPGHGSAIIVNRALVEALLSKFPAADHSRECPTVAEVLSKRLADV